MGLACVGLNAQATSGGITINANEIEAGGYYVDINDELTKYAESIYGNLDEIDPNTFNYTELLMNFFGVSEEVVLEYENSHGYPPLNVTVEGLVSLSGNNTTVFSSSGGLIFAELESSSGIQSGLALSDNAILNVGREYDPITYVNVNGNISVSDSTLNIYSSQVNMNGDIFIYQGNLNIFLSGTSDEDDNSNLIEINGNISIYNGNFSFTKSYKGYESLLINGNIMIDGDETNSQTVSNFTVPPAQTELVGIYAQGQTIDVYLKDNTLFKINRPATTFNAGDDIFKAVSLNGNITVTNTENTSNQVILTLTAPDKNSWSWKGGAALIGNDWKNSSVNRAGIFVEADDGAVWNVQGIQSSEGGLVSTISQWNSLGSTTIDLSQSSKFQTVRIDNLTGNGTTMIVKVGAEKMADRSVLT